MTTVVAKLFAVAGRCRAYFGEKDFQQLQVVRRMARDLSLPVEVVGCPTVRDPDGLALSSRNGFLTPTERAAAPVVQRALQRGARAVRLRAAPEAVRAAMVAEVATEPLVALEYAEVVDPTTLGPPRDATGAVRLLIAARVGGTRLIDNIGVAS